MAADLLIVDLTLPDRFPDLVVQPPLALSLPQEARQQAEALQKLAFRHHYPEM